MALLLHVLTISSHILSSQMEAPGYYQRTVLFCTTRPDNSSQGPLFGRIECSGQEAPTLIEFCTKADVIEIK